MQTAEEIISDLARRLLAMERTAAMPAGTVQDYVGATAPAGWALLDGSTITNAQTLYPALWAVVPAGWKVGANLALPDARGRVGVAKAASGTFATLGGTGGTESATLTGANLPAHQHDLGSHTHGGLTGQESPAHTHNIDHNHPAFTSGAGSPHSHGDSSAIGDWLMTAFGAAQSLGTTGGPAYGTTNVTATESAHTHSIDVPALGTTASGSAAHQHSIAAATGNTGDGPGTASPVSVLQPYLVLNRIIKVH